MAIATWCRDDAAWIGAGIKLRVFRPSIAGAESAPSVIDGAAACSLSATTMLGADRLGHGCVAIVRTASVGRGGIAGRRLDDLAVGHQDGPDG